MPRWTSPVVALAPFLLLACAGAGPGASGEQAGRASAPEVTAAAAWPMPVGCASRFRPDSYGHVKDAKPLLIKDMAALLEQVECREDVKLDFDFSAGWVAMFRFTSQGGSFKELSVEDVGGTVTLTVESTSYCGGARPPTTAEAFFYVVPRRTGTLATKVVPADQPPCSPFLP